MDQIDRIFRLHRLLHGRRTGISSDDLQTQLECSRATLNRCIAYLRDTLNAPLIHDAERGGYRYDGDGLHELPGLWFSAEEIAALLVLGDLLKDQPPACWPMRCGRSGNGCRSWPRTAA